MSTVDEVDGPRFFSLARRTFAFEGVMRIRAEQEENAPRQIRARPPSTPQQQVAQPKADNNVVPLDAFRASFPGLVSHGTEGR